MAAALPKTLGNSPLVEVLFEMRFEPAQEAAGDLLPGLLYVDLKESYPDVTPLQPASAPRQLRDRTADLLHRASHELRGGPNVVQVGDRVVAVSSLEYPGWIPFKKRVELVLTSLRATGLVRAVNRFSFRYINVIQKPETAARCRENERAK